MGRLTKATTTARPARFDARPPLPGNPDWLDVGIEKWREAAERCEDDLLRRVAPALLDDNRSGPLLAGIFGNSPFLTRCLSADPAYAVDVLQNGPDEAFRRTLDSLEATCAAATSAAEIDRGLRLARRQVAAVVGLADLSGAWPLERVTGALSSFADRAIGHAARRHFIDAAGRGAFEIAGDGDPLARSGLFFLGMGKLGAGELNYSSDIDVIVLYDPELVPATDASRMREQLVRVTQNVVTSLQKRTEHGNVFRTDLRLRPDPASTPLAISTPAAEAYYESMGQNWERAAMIKARVVAGDMAAGEAFLDVLLPFVWRRNLDFAAIQDIHSIKRQIIAHRGGAEIAVAGHNVKLGRGGIREIEFFAQTQQLIFGGRDPSLRVRGTRDALAALVAAGRVDAEAADELYAAYRYLRTVEHRLQMVDDQQTHTLPEDEGELAAFAAFMGYADTEGFAEDLLYHLRRVEDHYGVLFEDSPSLGHTGNLVFTGGDHDPDTLKTLAELGFADPEAVSSLIRGWHHGRYNATRSARARELLTELVPALIDAIAATANPDIAFRRFDEFLRGLPTGVQLFSLFHANPELMALLAEIMGSAPRLSAHLGRKPALIDAVLAGDFFEPPPDLDMLKTEIVEALDGAVDHQDALDFTRRWAADRQFQIDVQFLRAMIDADAAGAARADVADAAIGTLLPAVEEDFAHRHGRMRGGAFAVLALGKLGGRELSTTSDLDLVFVYRTSEDVGESDGEKPLAASHFYARFAQRYLNALTAPTAEGSLYEVDMRLRPAGAKGPLASSLEAFARYQASDAWIWEHMAMTRARPVAGDPALVDDIMATIRDSLTRPHDPDALLREVAQMRARMAAAHKAERIWQIKHVPGGLVDVEFIAQYLQLRHAAETPEVLSANTAAAFERLRDAGALDAGMADKLAEAARLWQRVQAMLRLTVDDRFDPDSATVGLKSALARAAGAPSFDALVKHMEQMAERVRAAYDALIAAPAAALPHPDETKKDAKET